MTIQEFQLLSQDQKEDVVGKHGVFMATYDECNALCDAYELFDFYVAYTYEIGVSKKANITVHLNPDEFPFLLKINKIH